MKKPIVNLPGEEWRPIKDLPTYQVSNLGRVASFVLNTPYIKRHTQDKRNYCRISLRPSPGKAVTKYIHLLVAEAFLPPPAEGQEIDHIDGNAANNTLQNLRWCSHKENINHAIARRGMWLKPRKPTPIFQIHPDNSITQHASLKAACQHLSKPPSSAANISAASTSGGLAYGFKWTRKPWPKQLASLTSNCRLESLPLPLTGS